MSSSYNILRTYKKVFSDAKDKGISSLKLLALEITEHKFYENNIELDSNLLLLWKKSLKIDNIIILDKNGKIIFNINDIVNYSLKNKNYLLKVLKGTTVVTFEKDPIDQVETLFFARPLLIDFEPEFIIAISYKLDKILGNDFKRNGLFLLSKKDGKIFYGPTNLLGLHLPTNTSIKNKLLPVTYLGNNLFKGQYSIFKFVFLPVIEQNFIMARLFPLNSVIFLRSELCIIIFLLSITFIVFIHKLLSSKYFSLVLEKEISIRKQTFESLKILASAIEQSADSIIITDKNGIINYVNPAFCKSTGFNKDEILGKYADFTPMSNNRFVYKSIWATITNGKIWKGRLHTKKKDSSYLQEEATIFPIKNHRGEIERFVAVKKDITREVELETLLLHAQKLESIGLLAGGIAHDFNNILSALQMNLDLIKLQKCDFNSAQPYLENIQHGISRASDLVKQLLLFSKRKSIDTSVIDLNKAIITTLKMVKRILGEDIKLEIEKEKNLWPIKASLNTIDQIIMNLAVNARDAMPKGGILKISTSNITLKEQGKDKPFVHLQVSDTGHGMSAKIVQRIFDPFFTTKETGKGTGLGLSVVYGIVKQLDGHIDVESEEGKGATFNIYFPAYLDKSYSKKEQNSIIDTLTKGNGETILLIEDEEAVRLVIQEALKENNFKVIAASGIKEAQKIYEDHKEDIDLIISDIILADGNGFEFIENILSQSRLKKHVIFISGYTGDKIKQEEIQNKNYPFLQKPFKIEKLLQVVNQVLSNKN